MQKPNRTSLTNIVINIKSKKNLRFDSKEKIGNSSFGTLYLPDNYASAWVIDGQHRIYGYAQSKRFIDSKPDTATLPVLAYENLPTSEEAQLFVDINCEQVKVSKNLLNEIYATLKWDSDDFEERNYALRSRVVMSLDSKKISPFYGRIITTGRDKNYYRCLTLTSFNDGLKENKFFGLLKGGVVRPGPFSYKGVDDLENSLKKAVDILINYFSSFSEKLEDHWELGADKGGFLCTNNGVRALLRVLRRYYHTYQEREY
ncbi:MAG: DGQHR domain-containing protein [Desulfotignum sp.]|nr:DGQHR domain-containing protein [Desulfotignum sp.]